VLNRIGLRYTDECPLPTPLANDQYRDYYNTSFPLERFPIQDAQNIQLQTVVKRGNHFLTFIENYFHNGDNPALIMDFDAFSLNVKSSDYLTVCDELHTIISDEYEKALKEPVYEIMKCPKEQQ